jgi:hypothetical protein
MSEFWDMDDCKNTNITDEMFSENVKKTCQKNLKNHHDLYPTINLKSEYWESILTKSFRSDNFKCNWLGEFKTSHKPGTDIIVDELKYSRISCKSGTVRYDKKLKKFIDLKISGFRTTKYPTLEEKLEYIDSNHEDVIYSLSSSLFKRHKKYILTIFLPPKFKKLQWTKITTEKNKVNYVSSKVDGLCAWITDSQSAQLWYVIDYNSPLILEKHEIQL